MNVHEHNRRAWDAESRGGSRWCTPVDRETVARARCGDWAVILTPNRTVPRAWFGAMAGRALLCLASGGGQQAPVLAAAGARVTSFDASAEQLAKDRRVAQREGLDLHCEQGDMADLGRFPDGSFELVFHPISNVFVPDPAAVWRECQRVLWPRGVLLAGFMNPQFFLFDHDEAQASGQLTVRHRLPYAELSHLDETALRHRIDAGQPLEFGHSLDTQIGGQLAAGFVLTDLYEDWWADEATPLNRYAPTSIATRALKR